MKRHEPSGRSDERCDVIVKLSNALIEEDKNIFEIFKRTRH